MSVLSCVLVLSSVSQVMANFPVPGPTAPASAQACYQLLSANSTQDICFVQAEFKWDVSIPPTPDFNDSKVCNAWVDTLQCINEAVCQLCSENQSLDIMRWETEAYMNSTFCPNKKPFISWCQTKIGPPDANTQASSANKVAMIVVVFMMSILLAGFIGIVVLMLKEPPSSERKTSLESNTIQESLDNDIPHSVIFNKLGTVKSRPPSLMAIESKNSLQTESAAGAKATSGIKSKSKSNASASKATLLKSTAKSKA